MEYTWLTKLHDEDGDVVDDGLFIFAGENTALRFKNSKELEQFALDILKSLPEIREKNPKYP